MCLALERQAQQIWLALAKHTFSGCFWPFWGTSSIFFTLHFCSLHLLSVPWICWTFSRSKYFVSYDVLNFQYLWYVVYTVHVHMHVMAWNFFCQVPKPALLLRLRKTEIPTKKIVVPWTSKWRQQPTCQLKKQTSVDKRSTTLSASSTTGRLSPTMRTVWIIVLSICAMKRLQLFAWIDSPKAKTR